MAKFRKKPVVIEAIQWDGSEQSWNNIINMGCTPDQTEGMGNAISIATLEGVMTASFNDYIIKGIKGEFCPCKPDIFESTYEKLDES